MLVKLAERLIFSVRVCGHVGGSGQDRGRLVAVVAEPPLASRHRRVPIPGSRPPPLQIAHTMSSPSRCQFSRRLGLGA
jgi:hypothetical protein